MNILSHILAFLWECLFYAACGWIGHWTVKILTLGRVNLDWGETAEGSANNHQTPQAHYWVIGNWSLFGIWDLEFGI